MICCGEETERQYIDFVKKSLHLRSVTVKHRSDGSAPDRLVEVAARETTEFDQVWIVCDVDNYQAQITKAVAAAKVTGVHLAISNPCFEIWLIWHAESNHGQMTIKQSQQRASNLQLVDGKKNKDLRPQSLKGKFIDAEQRACSARAEHARAQRVAPDNIPSSDVDLLIRAVLDAEGAQAEAL